jgi:hypothetical protein
MIDYSPFQKSLFEPLYTFSYTNLCQILCLRLQSRKGRIFGHIVQSGGAIIPDLDVSHFSHQHSKFLLHVVYGNLRRGVLFRARAYGQYIIQSKHSD